jgi:hypothetical protein
MNDPFAMLDPVAKPAQPQAGSGSFATAPYGGYGPGYQQQQQQQQQPSNPFTAGNPPMMAQWQQQPPQQQGYPYGGAMFMTQQGPPAFGGLAAAPNMMTTPYMPQSHQQQQQMYPQASPPMPSFGGQPIAYDSIKNLMQPKAPADPFATDAGATKTANPFEDSSGMLMRPAEPTSMSHPPPAPLVTQSSAIVVDFDPFSPQNGTPRTPFDFPDQASTAGSSGAFADRLGKRQTQESQRSQLGFSSDGFATASANAPKVSLRDATSTVKAPSTGFDNDPFFTDGSDPFAGQTFANLDDDQSSSQDWGALSGQQRRGSGTASNASDESSSAMGECAEDEYDVTFETGRKLGVLMERVDVWTAQAGQTGSGERRVETAVVKLVVENGAADRVGVTVGSSVVAINHHRVSRDSYTNVLEMIKAAPRPLVMRFRRGAVNKDTTQGTVLTRISSALCHATLLPLKVVSVLTHAFACVYVDDAIDGTFSVGNLTSGNAVWSQKYFAFGGAKMDVLQLFVSRAAYHEVENCEAMEVDMQGC